MSQQGCFIMRRHLFLIALVVLQSIFLCACGPSKAEQEAQLEKMKLEAALEEAKEQAEEARMEAEMAKIEAQSANETARKANMQKAGCYVGTIGKVKVHFFWGESGQYMYYDSNPASIFDLHVEQSDSQDIMLGDYSRIEGSTSAYLMFKTSQFPYVGEFKRLRDGKTFPIRLQLAE